MISGWIEDNHTLCKTYTFGSFEEAIRWMQEAAEKITLLNHHPEWTNVYNKVLVRLTTHEASNRITEKDIILAEALDWCFEHRNS